MNRTTKDTGTSSTQSTHTAFNNLADKMDTASERIRNNSPEEGRIHDAAEVVAKRVEDAGAYLREVDVRGLMRDTGKLIKKHPIAFAGIGLCFGFWLSRRRR